MSKTPADPSTGERDTMFMAAVSALAEISVALGIPDDEAACANGNDLILERIAELHAAQAPSPVAPSEPVYSVFMDGDQWCAVGPGFTNLQESPVGFADTPYLALERLREEEGNAKRLALRAAIPDAPVAPSEPAYYVSGPYSDGSMSVCELATGKILHKFRLDGAAIPDEKAEHWCALEHGGVFCRHCDAAAIQPRQAEPTCAGCNGNGEVGGLLSDGYHSEQCPFCHGSGVEPRQAPSDALTDEEIVGRAKARGIHDGEAAISLVRAILSTQGDRNG